MTKEKKINMLSRNAENDIRHNHKIRMSDDKNWKKIYKDLEKEHRNKCDLHHKPLNRMSLIILEQITDYVWLYLSKRGCFLKKNKIVRN